MPDATTLMRQKLKNCDLKALFIEELGWNHHRALPLLIQNDGDTYVLNAVAEKHGMVAYECQPGPGGQIPDYPTRGKIERQVAKSAHEHIVVFVNQDRTLQTWQWVRREKDKPTARREHPYFSNQPGDSLIQKLQNLMVSLEEEEKLTIVDVTGKVRQAFDVDRVTKRFYDRFRDEHRAFLAFIEGITIVTDREWYASLMLNRLMFIYFIQKKGFLNGDTDYLRNRLQMVRASQGKGNFHTFYRYFLRRLFHEGLAQRPEDRKGELNTLLGNVPYLNGGLFDAHQLENDNPGIQIPDDAFERLFNFFDAYQWHLDERPTRSDNEINPDVLGYIFEKYINQKQMGAYYTKEDITEYISKSTIIPFLFDAAEKKCAIAFRPDGAVWRLLRDDPDRYIYEAVKKGVDLPLPPDIAAGVSDVSKRGGWNKPADDVFGLPIETWREHIARRNRCLEVRAKLAAGEIHNINDFITYNLDLRQFAQDVIETCEGPELLRAIYQSIEELSVLDPTSGSGAFLFAALNILEPLYEACLERMEVFVSELDRSGEKHHPEKFSDFRNVLTQANNRTKHPSRRYFILKSIVLRNLYGVDIMAEAVEICKLRLFLKLVAQVERAEDIEPLPDIDFNIRAGNTLVGFTSLESVKRAMTIRPDGRYRMVMPEDEAALKRIDESAELADKAFRRFREQQTEYGMQVNQYSTAKSDLHTRLAALRTELDRYLATEYGIDLKKPDNFTKWRSSHQPFHWFVEFYGIMAGGGFNVIIGNPPYVEYSKVKKEYLAKGYESESCGNLYAFIIERCIQLLNSLGHFGMIVQNSIVSTDRMQPIQKILVSRFDNFISNFDDRPAKLFTGLNHMKGSIILSAPKKSNFTYSTNFLRWYDEERENIFHLIHYINVSPIPWYMNHIPKIGTLLEKRVVNSISSQKSLSAILRKSGKTVYCHRIASYFIKSTDFEPYFFNETEGNKKSEDYKEYYVGSQQEQQVLISLFNSGIFLYFWHIFFDGYHCGRANIESFPFSFPVNKDSERSLSVLTQKLMASYKENCNRRETNYKNTGKVIYDEFSPAKSKQIIDEIDAVIARHYGFTEEELDYITNYDIKYRMGGTGSDDDDE